ncbi:transcriptional regulator [Sphingomonas oleivorans]|uniref:Transcriptional regulator n=1 Tax=Sphingomonas oleivorans TaxID=1735121 RepID=A0A2T5FYU6_9SPHN|nr:response regulator [Sphingomonas oleivorans]PTQ11695.1 transcriptional regulator [Sphingomonas oleivorans]
MTAPLSVLIIEDEPLVAMMLEDFVEALGHRVAGSADCIGEALGRVEAGGFDIAILDVNLRDGVSWPVADALADRGFAFVLATGGHLDPPPARHAGAALLSKPFTLNGVRTALEGAASA